MLAAGWTLSVVGFNFGSGGAAEMGIKMPTVLVVHEVDDVNQWLTTPKRAELFSKYHVSFRAFADRDGSNRVGLILEVPDLDVVSKIMADEGMAEAMKHDGVRPETLLILQEVAAFG